MTTKKTLYLQFFVQWMLKACEQSPTLKRKIRTPDKNKKTFIRRNKVCSWPNYELMSIHFGGQWDGRWAQWGLRDRVIGC